MRPVPTARSAASRCGFIAGCFPSACFSRALRNTLIYAFGSAVIAIVIGTVQALIVERTNTPGRKLAFFGAIISLGVPHILYVVAWLLLLGRAGPVNDAIHFVTQHAQASDVYSMWGMALIEGIGFVPLTFLLMSAVLRSMDASFEEAAIMAGASPLRAFWCRHAAHGHARAVRAGVAVLRPRPSNRSRCRRWLGSPATSMC